MPLEIETYRPTLEGLRKRAEQLYPGKFTFMVTEVAKLIGIGVQTVYDRGYIKPKYCSHTTVEELARKIAKDTRN